MYVRLLFFILFIITSFFAKAQEVEKCKKIPTQKAVVLDSLTVLPHTIRVAEGVPWRFSPDENTVQVTSPALDSVEVCFQTLGVAAHQAQHRYDLAAYEAGALLNPDEKYVPTVLNTKTLEKEELFKSDLQKSGSLTRGLSVGNAQDVFVNSAINLQLEGMLTEDIRLEAIITDQQVPFQPEGNTQQIQDFDRVLLRLIHEKGSVEAGDVILQDENTYFLRFYKNTLGAKVNWHFGSDSTAKEASGYAGINLAKGQFFSQQLEVREGVQGPYRLSGPNGNNFIVILAGSERVFLDGKLLTRGENQDYVIDYNTSELRFTPRVILTRFSQVRVDFEFALQQYARSIVSGQQRLRFGQFHFTVAAYREGDNPNRPLFGSLNEADVSNLQAAGDMLQEAEGSTVQEVESFSPDQVLYTYRDTLINGQNYRYLARATAEDTDFYRASFSFVGMGNGDYVQGDLLSNGRTFTFVGINQGDYSPRRQLYAPNRREMWVAKSEYYLSEERKFFGEFALSNYDQNLFSQRGNADNIGQAFRIGYVKSFREKRRRNSAEKAPWETAYQLAYEQNSPHFAPIDRYRSVEVDRLWDIAADSLHQDQIATLNFHLRKQSTQEIKYLGTLRRREGQGMSHEVETKNTFFRLKTNNRLFYLNSTTNSLSNQWLQWQSTWRYPLRGLVPGYRFSGDRQAFREENTGEITRAILNYEAHTFFVENPDTLEWKYRLSHQFRNEWEPRDGVLLQTAHVQETQLELEKKGRQQSLNVGGTLRRVEATDSLRESQNVLMGNLSWKAEAKRGWFRQQANLQTSVGREPRRDLVFLPADVGQGTHTWRDDNGDGIQQINEFYEALNPDERNYVKFWLPTGEFTDAFHAQLIYRLLLRMPKSKKKQQSQFQNFMKRWSFAGYMQVQRTNTSSDLLSRFLPFLSPLNAENILSGRGNWRGTLRFSPGPSGFGAEAEASRLELRSLLADGFEGQRNDLFTLSLQKRLSSLLLFQLKVQQLENAQFSDLMPNRNYLLRGPEVLPELQIQPSQKLRLGLLYRYSQKKDVQEGNPNSEALQHEIRTEARYLPSPKSNLSGQVRWANIRFTGEENTPVSYALLEALQPGQNVTWQLNIQHRLSNGLRFTLTYDGRKSQDLPVRHTGRVQLTALF